MKKSFSFKLLKWLFSAIFLFCVNFSVCAITEVHVENAGALSTKLTSTETSLKITGFINGTDIKYLRELISVGKITSLDISEVRIVSGGEAYLESYSTENDVIGECMFMSCSRLRTIVLPSTILEIQSNAFARSGLTKIDIPNSVSRLGNDAFAYCNNLISVVIGGRVSKLDQGVFYSSPVKTAFVKPLTPPSTPAYLFSSSPIIRVYSEVLEDYKQSSWADYGTITGKLETYYPQEEDSSEIVNSLIGTYFEDAACTKLKTEYIAMTDEVLTTTMKESGMPSYMIAIALKQKNNNWANYEKDFRIQNYKAFSDAEYWNKRLKSTGGSYMGNPTGIYSNNLEPLYVFVDGDVPEDATLYIASCVDNDIISNAKTGTRLSKGLNIINGQANALYYILYTADTQSQTKKLTEWPEMKIYIEGGVVNGYYDVARKSDKDYQALLNAATHDLFTIKSTHALFNFKTSTYKKVWPSTIDRSICWFDSLTVWQQELMGYCESVANGQRAQAPYNLTGGEAIAPLYYNNPNFAIEGDADDAGYANSSSYRTSYNSVECISNSFNVNRYEMDDWCAGHECGHNNQGTINLEGGTEVSNNLFSNVGRFLFGRVTSVGSPLSVVMNEYAHGTPYYIRPVDSQLRMYYQLYLYYHQAQKNTSFYPNLFKALREDPLDVWGNSYNSSLKFVRKVCEVAQEDLTDFFTAWGFFEPFNNMAIEDYGAHTMTVTQADIDRTLADISKYPKNRTILFVEDRAQYVLTTDMFSTPGQKRRESDKVGQCGELGQFTDYMEGATEPSNYTYIQSDSLYSMSGTGGVGFLMLDKEGKIVYAANALNFCIPSSVGSDFTIYSIDADGTMREVTKAGDGTEYVTVEASGTLSDSLSIYALKAIINGPINGTDIKYLRQLINENSLSSIDLTATRIMSGGDAYYEDYKSVYNTIGNYAFYECHNLTTMNLPERIMKIESNAFAHSGLYEIIIPEFVTTIGGDAFAYCDNLTTVTIGSKVRTMAQGVFYGSNVKEAYVKALSPPSVSAYLFSSNPVIHVYAKSLTAYLASDWAKFGTIVGDLDDYTSIQLPQEGVVGGDEQMAPIYDLYGRKVTHLRPGTIYVRNGKKFVTAP